jgi:GrpB-like predicted nucleotidyltransferase (UPF0157 family)
MVMQQQPGSAPITPTGEDERVDFAPEQTFREAIGRLFMRVQAELQALLPGADIQHVGSTAIPGSLTKGDLDVQVRVSSDGYVAAKEALSTLYGVNLGGFASEDAISFEDYSAKPSLGIHLTVIDGSADIQWRFRDLLIASPGLRDEYDRLKRRFDGGSMSQYRDAKAKFVSRVLQADALDEAP